MGGPLSDWSWLKASLPSSQGGFNLRSASLLAPAAFLASSSGSQPLVEQILGHPPGPPPHIRSALSTLASAAVHPDWQSLDDIDVPLRQHSLSLSIDDASFQHLHLCTFHPLPSFGPLIQSASRWGRLNVVPSASLGLHLQNCEFQCCLCYWLGVPFHSNPFPCPECRGIADSFRDHQVGCGGNGDRISRHNAIRDVVFSAAQSAALAPSKEIPSQVPCSQSRPADILLPNWSCGRPAALDVHVISPLQQQTIAEASRTPGHTLQVGVHRKLASNLSACRSTGTAFIPLVAETLGGLAEVTINTVRSIGHAIADKAGFPDPAITSRHLFGRFAIALWRGNASLWQHRHPTLPPSLDGVV